MKLIGIRYEEFEAGTYAGVEVSEPDPESIRAHDGPTRFKEPVLFFTGNPAEDVRAALASGEGEKFMFLSSFDHFMSDDPGASAGLDEYR